MKYERISSEELLKLEKEFIDFLVVNGITAEDWVDIKLNKPQDAEEIILQFSDVVWESILRSTTFLKKMESNKAFYFKCDKENIAVKIITKDDQLVKSASKKYSKTRELEMFDMIKNGCIISDGKSYKQLK